MLQRKDANRFLPKVARPVRGRAFLVLVLTRDKMSILLKQHEKAKNRLVAEKLLPESRRLMQGDSKLTVNHICELSF